METTDMPTKHVSSDEPADAIRVEFGRRLQALMLERNWNQAELARRSGLGRDSISTYVRGQTFPEPKSLKLLADALETTPQALMPQSHAVDVELPAFEIRQVPGQPDRCHIRINRLVTLDQAARIFSIIRENHA
jgi:transcriptional regulator with XRE-family HTH domain